MFVFQFIDIRKEHILEVYKFEKSVSVLNDCGKEQKQRSLVFEKFFTDLLPEYVY